MLVAVSELGFYKTIHLSQISFLQKVGDFSYKFRIGSSCSGK
ncbi:hypothetical protein RINTHH_19310 [Richelia intracellularis HH01]|uniref:Uncharacterized protein n=1 Tax=Richelia intracellularis HH01 TaxID=1165094 RepID=M1X6E8_9NOST|nr:hypothetical protein RINTHH_19310 [Richelia intracellularis HH01]